MLRLISLVVFGFTMLAAHARPAAAGTVGVVVTGELSFQPPLVAQIEGWLRSHGHEVVALALDSSATTRLIDCFTVDDSPCARKVVESAARSESVVFARASREGPTVNLTVHWITKGRPPVGGRRGCEPCTTDAIRGAADELMASLASAATGATGRLKLSSKPPGVIVMLDGTNIGVTPIERDIAAGPHTIVLVSGGTEVGKRTVQIPADSTIEVTMPVEYPPDDPRRPSPGSRVLPVALFAAGGAALVGSGVAFYLGQKGGSDDKYIYPGATATGLALAGVGAAAISVGIWLWVRDSRESAPVAAIGPGAGYFGWQGRF